jgi:cGMP-dependent protein kinase
MRVCFETLCFSSQRLAEDEEDPNVATSLAAVNGAPPRLSGEPLVVMDPAGGNLQELQVLLQTKDLRIRDLEAQLRVREQEILELRSHLDKFQSVFPYHIKNNQLRPRKKRAQGISAEPQSHSTIQELSEQSFPTFDKNDR